MELPTDPVPAPEHTPTAAEAEMVCQLQEASALRHISYKLPFLVTLYFESDETRAKEDSNAFVSYMKEIIDLPDFSVLRFVIPTDANAESFCLSTLFPEIDKIRTSCEGRKLMIFHVACHGALESNGELVLGGKSGDPPGLTLSWNNLHFPIIKSRAEKPENVTDTFALIDSCCAAGAFFSPNRKATEATVEVLAACEGNAITNGRVLENIHATFTQRVIMAFKSLLGDETKPPVTIPNVLQILNLQPRDPKKPRPMYEMIYGDLPILLPLKTRRLPAIEPSKNPHSHAIQTLGQKSHRVALNVHVPNNIGDPSTKVMVNWILELRRDYGVEILGVYESDSTVILLTVPYSGLHMINRLEDRDLCNIKKIADNLFSNNKLAAIIAT